MSKDIPRIGAYFHCKSCLSGNLAVGWTIEGFQVFCEHCELSVIDIDFKGQKVVVFHQPEDITREELA